MPTPELKPHIPKGARIILVRHGQPALPLRPRTSHRGFRDYIDAYEAAGLDPDSLPPQELADLVKELDHVFTSGRPRAHQSAQALAPHAELMADPLFAEAPLASPAHSASEDAGAQMGGGGAGAVACGLSSRDRELPQSQAPRRPRPPTS